MTTRIAAFALVAALALPMIASAQQGQGHAPGNMPDPRAARHARMCADLDAHQAARLAWLEAKVKPTDAQRAAWDAFLRESRAAAAPLRAQCAPDQARPQRGDLAAELGQREQRLAAMLDAVRQTRAAVEKLSPQLDEAQRSALAENFGGGRMRHGMHRGHGMMRDGHGPDGARQGPGMRQGG
jgi:hypothetical protein